jgi:KipI family sensor histidine kinase inhibitor
MRYLPARDDALLIECADLQQSLALFASLTRDPITGVGELVPGARTVLVNYTPRVVSAAAIERTVRARDLTAHNAAADNATARNPTADNATAHNPTAGNAAAEERGHVTSPGGRVVEIPVTYTGEDLAEVAALLGRTPAEVVALHTGAEYSVGFTGFAPGFAYLTGGPAELDVPRRSNPRTRIPAGAVALAGTFSGVYPRESPGGWQLIGSTRVRMWDLERARPALLQPGDRVRFVDVAGGGPAHLDTDIAQKVVVHGRVDSADALEVAVSGLLTTLQDLGRPGLAKMGVPESGAADPVSLRAANRLVGNAPGEACLEMTFGGLAVTARGVRVVAVTGAEVPLVITGSNGAERRAVFGSAVVLSAGESLSVGMPIAGLRSYLAVRGGFVLEPVLGSVSTDLLSGIGPDPIAAGDVLAVRRPTRGLAAVEVVGHPPVAPRDVVLDVVLGPRTDWFTDAAVASFAAQVWEVNARSNRVGLRLDGAPLARAITRELPSEGTVAGAIQIPPNGMPVMFLTDHPVTGGYPVIAAVVSGQLALAGQLPPGTQVRFRPVVIEDKN